MMETVVSLLSCANGRSLEDTISSCTYFLLEVQQYPPYKAKMVVAEGWQFNNEARCPIGALEEFKYTITKTPAKNGALLHSEDE